MCVSVYHCCNDNYSRCLGRHMDATNRLALLFVVCHQQSMLITVYSAHFTGHFLPWHRLYLHTMEGLLRDKRGYKEYMTYWD